MIKNYIKIAWRNLVKHRVFSIINIAGLSFSVAFCLLVFFYISDEQSYDKFHEKKDRLFRVEMGNTGLSLNQQPPRHLFSFLTKDNDVKNRLVFPLIVGPDMQIGRLLVRHNFQQDLQVHEKSLAKLGRFEPQERGPL